MKMNRANMPVGWEPPAPAWTTHWENAQHPVTAAYFAVQGGDSAAIDSWASTAMFGESAPEQVEQGVFRDSQGVLNKLYIAYWRLPDYQAWWAQHGDWWQDPARRDEGVGYWRETICMPLERTETLHSTPMPHGGSTLAAAVVGPIEEHGYAGGMRDRVPVSTEVDLHASRGITEKLDVSESGAGLRLVPPANMCVIRSGQNWRNCQGEQAAYYLEVLQPVLIEGMTFLRDNPVETGCYSMRFVTCTDRHWQPLEESFGLGYAIDIFAFEEWAKSHPTHLAIFGNFMTMAERFGEALTLKLWHEVSALDGTHCEFEYIGCHNDTGLLPYT